MRRNGDSTARCYLVVAYAMETIGIQRSDNRQWVLQSRASRLRTRKNGNLECIFYVQSMSTPAGWKSENTIYETMHIYHLSMDIRNKNILYGKIYIQVQKKHVTFGDI